VVPGKARTLAGDYITSVGFVGEATLEKNLIRWTLVIVTLAATLLLGSIRAEEIEKVLFVGNSFTYYNNSLHTHYSNFRDAENGGKPVGRVRAMTVSGSALPEHRLGLQQRLQAEDWDIVVLQGYSTGPITEGSAEPFRQSARNFAAEIREDGGEPVFFMTWAYTGKPEMTQRLDDAYTSIGKELDAMVVPVGRAFESSLAERPDLDLVVLDLKHPTLAGTYLAACTFYAALHRETPVGGAYTAGLSDEDALFLQQVAWDSWQEYSAD
jgi:hypothetical protein